jgi:RNA polymerase sigma-70 factor (ECF subfamily)
MSVDAETNTSFAKDPNEGFLRLWTHHEPQVRAFVHACLPRAIEVDEIMQNVSLVAWREFTTLEDQSQFPRWVCLIARYEILMARRRHAWGPFCAG